MAEIHNPIKVGNYWTNLIDSDSGASVNYEEVSTWYDGSPMNDGKCDGKYYRKLPESKGGGYVRLVIDSDTVYKTTISEIRTNIGLAPIFYNTIVTTDSGQEGDWKYSASDSLADNTGTVLVTELGFRLLRIYDNNTVNVKWFGAVGDGVVDDTEPINSAISTLRNVLLPMGTYNISDEIILNDRQSLFYDGTASWTGTSRKAIIKYVGGADPDKCVIRLSRQAVGVDPGSGQVTGVNVENLFLDANNLVGFGLYCAYLTGDSNINNITVARATRHCLWIGRSWYARFTRITAYQGLGAGITIGDTSEYAWATQVNGLTIRDIRAHSNGRAGTYEQGVSSLQGYGVGLFDAIAINLDTVISENNDGPGIVFAPSGRVGWSVISNVYIEGNGISAVNDGRASSCWGILVNPLSSNARGWKIENVFLWGESGQTNIQEIRIQGSTPSGANSEPIHFDNIWGGQLSRTHERFVMTNRYFSHGIAARGAEPFNNKAGISNELFSVKPYNDNTASSWGIISYARGSGDNNSRLLFGTRVTLGSAPGYANFYMSNASSGPISDNSMTAGSASSRYSVVYAGSGTINTSDGIEKRDIRSLDESEIAVAISLKGLIKAFRFKDAFELKGDNARIHFGVIAQEVEQAFINEGLDPSRYALFCKDSFYTHDGVNYELDGVDVPAGALLVERFGIRYDELLAFIISVL